MRTLWNAVSFLAVVNLLAIIFVGLWLWQSKRLTPDRVRDAKAIFALTVPEAGLVAKKAQADALHEQAMQAELAKLANPPMDSATQIQYVSLVRLQEAQSRQRLEDDKRMLMQQVAQAGAKVDERQAALLKEQAKHEAAANPDQQRKIDQQFLQTVKQYELAVPKQAKKMLVDLIAGGQQDQAVAYLKAMNPRSASKIIREFKTDPEIVMAKELLEKLRTSGLDAPGKQDLSTAQEHANAPGNSNPALAPAKSG